MAEHVKYGRATKSGQAHSECSLLHSHSWLSAHHSPEDCRRCFMIAPRATCHGASPPFPFARTSAPRERRKTTISAFPHLTARCKGVSLLLSDGETQMRFAQAQ